MGTTKIRRGYRIEKDLDDKFGEKIKTEGTDRSSRVRELIRKDVDVSINVKCVISVSQDTLTYCHQLMTIIDKDIFKYISKYKNISKDNVHLHIIDKSFIEILKMNEKKFKFISKQKNVKNS